MASEIREGRYAAIDIGTVTCRMLVADVRERPDGTPAVIPLAKEYAVTNLGEGVDATHCLSEEALARVMSAVDEFLKVRESLDTPENPLLGTLVMATSASRDAENAQEFADMLSERGLKLAVIPGSREAELSFLGASSAFAGAKVMVVDVGGGSTEISIGIAGAAPTCSKSFDIGCRRMTERFWDGYPPSVEALESARAWVRPQFESWLGENAGCASLSPSTSPGAGTSPSASPNSSASANLGSSTLKMVAVAGTATSAVSIRDAMEVYDSTRVHGAEVTAEQLDAIEQCLAAMTLPELENVVGLDPRRGPVIVAGMVILQEVMRAAGVQSFTASESDILEGMIMSLAAQPSYIQQSF